MKYSLNDVYKDFFGEEYSVSENIEEVVNKDINSLLIDEESIDLLKRIISYISDYQTTKKNKIVFNLLFKVNNKETINELESIIKDVLKSNNYLLNNSVLKVSLYDLEKIQDIKSNGLVIINGLKAIDLKSDEFKNKLFFELNNTDNMIILEGSEDEINHFFEYDGNLKESKYPFEIKEKQLLAVDVYNDILDSIDDGKFSDKFKIELLDYITATISKTTLDYISYRDTLIREIMFNNRIPKLSVEKSLDDIFKELNELVGLDNVKKTLYDLVDLITFKNKASDLKINNVNLHMMFLGNAGTGKTTVARIVAEILYNLHYIKENKLIEVTNKDLVAEYVGQTAPKTNDVIMRAMNGVLFIDEAYQLAVSDNNSYNAEAIATLIKAMEDYRDKLVVIFAGYTKEMQALINSNSGIISRIGYTLEFSDYTNEELVDIFKSMAKKSGFVVEDSAIDKLKEIINEHRSDKNFGNARFVRNVYEKSIIKHATNTKNKKRHDILITLTDKDITD